MDKTNQPTGNFIQSSKLYAMCSNAFSMIKNGKEKQAKEQYPMEYYLIKKYLPVDLKELAQILTRKLELH